MQDNWIGYIDAKFSEYDYLNSHENRDGFYPNRFYKINGTYVSFEFDGIEKIRKVECGHYFIENDFEYVSDVKAVLDKTKKNHLDFLQLSYDGENGEQFELDYNEENKNILDQFLKLPIENGWTENLYKYKGRAYKIIIEINDTDKTNFEIILLSTAEQDIPLLWDKTDRKLQAYLIDKFCRKKNIELEKTSIEPLHRIA